MAARAKELAEEAARWQSRAEQALRAGDEGLAREALARRGWVIAELAQLRADRDEHARIAADLLRGRRELDAKLTQLKLHQGTVAAGIAAAQGESPLHAEGPVWDRFAEAERRIEEQAIVDELSGQEIDGTDLSEQKVERLEQAMRAEDALAELKRKMKGP